MFSSAVLGDTVGLILMEPHVLYRVSYMCVIHVVLESRYYDYAHYADKGTEAQTA